MSANEKMVMVPRELLERYVSSVESHNYGFDGDDEIRALLNAAPTHKGQGEPVALPAKRTNFDYKQLGDDGYVAAKEWNAHRMTLSKHQSI